MCGLHMRHNDVSHFFFSSFCILLSHYYVHLRFLHFFTVCAACSTCLPVMWKGWELIALYIEVYIRGGLGLFGLACARGAY